jgi:hypothetical protein
MSQRNSNYERKPRDHYATPTWCTQVILPFIHSGSVIWEPACGSGAMSRVLSTLFPTIASDVEPGPEHVPLDFFACSVPPNLDGRVANVIVTNPPYDVSQKFVEHAVELMRPINGMVAMLMRVDWDSAKTRRHLFADCPAWSRKVVLTKRIMWFQPEPGAVGKSPSENHCWMIWDWKHRGLASIDYANPDWQEAAE